MILLVAIELAPQTNCIYQPIEVDRLVFKNGTFLITPIHNQFTINVDNLKKIDWTISSPSFLLSFLFGTRYLNPYQDLLFCLQLLLHRL